MKIEIKNARECFHRKYIPCNGDLCMYDGDDKLVCASTRMSDGFPKECPLRRLDINMKTYNIAVKKLYEIKASSKEEALDNYLFGYKSFISAENIARSDIQEM